MSTVFKHLGFLSVVKNLAILGIAIVLIGAGFKVVPWYLDRTRTGHVELSKGCSCDLSASAFYTSDGVVSYSENGVCIGRTFLSNDFLYDPLAIFPCPDNHSVVCMSWPDTFEAAFTIDFSKRSPNVDRIPDPLQGVAVDSSDFEVRACTTDEVAYVKDFIRTADLKTFAACIRSVPSAEVDHNRQKVIDFLTMATAMHDWRDPLMKNASPLLVAEQPDIVEAK